MSHPMLAPDTNEREIVETPVPESDIAALAYALWEERGSPIGSPEEDWFRAEEIIRVQNSERPSE